MKRVIFISMVFFIMISCGKEQNNPTRELKITFKSVDGVGNIPQDISVAFYPNPFDHYVNVHINGSNSANLLISNDAGGIKRITCQGNGTLDFSEESSGTYYCEVLVNKTVFRAYLIHK